MENKKMRFTTYIPTHHKEAIAKISDETRIPQSRLFEEAVEDLLKKYQYEQEGEINS